MRKAATKALYLFLCSILGMVLFAMLHRAIFVLYDLLTFVDPIYAFGLTQMQVAVIDFFTMLAALFVGGWYGTLMGIDWYAMVYGPNAEVRAGLFHGFLPHHWRGRKERKVKSASKPAVSFSVPAATSTTVKVKQREVVKEVPAEKPVREWTFEDLMPAKPVAKKRTVRKTAAKKTVRKTTTKKTVKAE